MAHAKSAVANARSALTLPAPSQAKPYVLRFRRVTSVVEDGYTFFRPSGDEARPGFIEHVSGIGGASEEEFTTSEKFAATGIEVAVACPSKIIKPEDREQERIKTILTMLLLTLGKPQDMQLKALKSTDGETKSLLQKMVDIYHTPMWHDVVQCKLKDLICGIAADSSESIFTPAAHHAWAQLFNGKLPEFVADIPSIAPHALNSAALFAPRSREMLRRRGVKNGEYICTAFSQGTSVAAIKTLTPFLSAMMNMELFEAMVRTPTLSAMTRLSILETMAKTSHEDIKPNCFAAFGAPIIFGHGLPEPTVEIPVYNVLPKGDQMAASVVGYGADDVRRDSQKAGYYVSVIEPKGGEHGMCEANCEILVMIVKRHLRHWQPTFSMAEPTFH